MNKGKFELYTYRLDVTFLPLFYITNRLQDAVTEFGWPTYKVEPLQESEKKDIIHGYMGLYGKTLNQEQTDLIINAQTELKTLSISRLYWTR